MKRYNPVKSPVFLYTVIDTFVGPDLKRAVNVHEISGNRLKNNNLLVLNALHKMMKNPNPCVLVGIFFVVCIIVAGCVAPPKDSPPAQTSSGTSSSQYSNPPNNPDVVTPPVTTTANFLVDATPFQTPVTPTLGYHIWTPTPTISQDQVCLIYFEKINSTWEVTKTAKTFNLKNPPMYINYTITDPFYITGTRLVNHKYAGQAEFANYKTLNPVAYLEVTVRNRTTGQIYTQDGFGRDHGQYLNKTIKVIKPDDMLIEFGGYNVTGVIGVWVKPYGNFGENETFVRTECKYASEFGPNTIGTTPTP